MKLEKADGKTIDKIWAKVQSSVGDATCAEVAAQGLVTAVRDQFTESIVIARAFMTIPFSALPAESQTFVRKLAESKGAASALKPVTPVLSLIGTSGREAEWCDRRKSKGHVGIPLISAEFVSSIPMISRLLKEIGIPLEWVDTQDTDELVRIVSGSAGLFFVEDASRAKDHEGRKIIVAEDFVAAHSVKSVFGVCGAYQSGQIVVLIFFSCDGIKRSVAEAFVGLVPGFTGATAAMVTSGRVFAP